MTTATAAPAQPANGRPDDRERRLLQGYLHKTSNTLCGIKGYASLIAARQAADESAEAWARKIIAEVEQMEEIFRSVGDLTRRRGHPDIGVDLPGLVTDLAGDARRVHPDLDLVVKAVPAGELQLPVADLMLMLKEILRNSAESARPEGRRVRVSLSGETDGAGRVFLSVDDDGGGMAPELVAMAATPFVTTKDDHHGVGLTRVDTLMDMYGLEWRLTSEPGTGTCVRLEVAEGG